jgi:AbiV family abortive infection protein
MPASVTSKFLLEGAAYALEQCGLMLRDADGLYRSGSYSNAMVLAAFAREELGKWKIFLDLRREVLGGKNLTIKDINDRCDDHVRKQKSGMLSLTMRADKDSPVGKILTARIEASPGSDGWREMDEKLAQIDRLKKKRVPSERHYQRMSALYVDALPDGRWNRPTTAILPMDAHDFLEDARNDYSGQHSRYSNPAFSNDDELSAALEQWSDRPVLPVPAGPLPLPETRAGEPENNSGSQDLDLAQLAPASTERRPQRAPPARRDGPAR